jgi:SAM-dependent methyltransferase
MTNLPDEKIELLSVDLLDQNRDLVVELRKLAKSLDLEFGWHYLLDLTWIISQLGTVEGKRIIDAGAGTGVIQWYLAAHGAEVISVDRNSREFLPARFRRQYKVKGLRHSDLASLSRVFHKDLTKKTSLNKRLKRFGVEVFDSIKMQRPIGDVYIYNQDLATMTDIQDGSIDAVVAVSSLEHNTPDGLTQVVQELLRVLRPGSPLIATLTAAAGRDTWHTPSSGWCYTDTSLRKYFDFPENFPSNYDEYNKLFIKLRNCSELRDNLASFYFESEHNGMPWGTWDPQYIPVGVCKIKER